MQSAALAALKRIEEESSRVFYPIIGSIKGRFLRELVKKHKPRRILEIGTFVGYSAILMADAYGECTIVTLERKKEIAERAHVNIDDAGFERRIRIIVGDAKEATEKLEEKFDFVFIDAVKEEYLTYLQLMEQHGLLAEKCVIVADNTKMFKDAMLDYLEYVREHYDSSEQDFGFDAMEVSVHKI